LIFRGTLAEAKLIAPRPRDMSLDNGYASNLLGRRLGDLDNFFSRLMAQRAESGGWNDYHPAGIYNALNVR
jgi:hypothetical protein